MVSCRCRWKGGRPINLCPAHRAFFRQLRDHEKQILVTVEEAEAFAGGPHTGRGSPGGGPQYLTSPVSERPARARRPGTTPTTDSIGLIAVGAALGAVWWLSPDGALWPYLVAPVAVFLLVFGVVGLAFNRPR